MNNTPKDCFGAFLQNSQTPAPRVKNITTKIDVLFPTFLYGCQCCGCFKNQKNQIPLMGRRSRSKSPFASGRKRDKDRDRDRDRDRDKERNRRKRSRDRSRDRDRERRHERRRLSNSRSRSRSRSIGRRSRDLIPQRPAVSAADLQGKTEDEVEMMKMMGFCSFDTTKGKKVQGNEVGAVHVILKRKYRQYMNRKGGFNRPLDFVA